MLPYKALESSVVLQVVSLITTVLITSHQKGGSPSSKTALMSGWALTEVPGLISAGSHHHFLEMFHPWTDPTLALLAF